MERRVQIAGLRTIRVKIGVGGSSVVLLHGHAMTPEALAPFAHSLGVDGEFFVPEGPIDALPSGRAWWPMDQERRSAMLVAGPRDLSDESPAGVDGARAQLLRFLRAIRAERVDAPLVVVGFSQGGMLAVDLLLRDGVAMDALAVLSSSRITAGDWEARLEPLRGMPVLVSHGERDEELSLQAGEIGRAHV